MIMIFLGLKVSLLILVSGLAICENKAVLNCVFNQ